MLWLEDRKSKFSDLISLWRGDITTLQIDAIVAAGNKKLAGCRKPGHCIDAAIFLKAGEELFDECRTLNGCNTGEAKITDAYALPCKKVIHTVGPKFKPGSDEETWIKQQNQLRMCYLNILNLAVKSQIKTVALCCISTGVFGFPNDVACRIAVNSVYEWLRDNNHNDGKDSITDTQIQRIIFDVWTEKDENLYFEELGKVFG